MTDSTTVPAPGVEVEKVLGKYHRPSLPRETGRGGKPDSHKAWGANPG